MSKETLHHVKRDPHIKRAKHFLLKRPVCIRSTSTSRQKRPIHEKSQIPPPKEICICQKRPYTTSKETHTSKEPNTSTSRQKRPIHEKSQIPPPKETNICQKRPTHHVKRDPHIKRALYFLLKRSIYVKRDLYSRQKRPKHQKSQIPAPKETNTCPKRPKHHVKRDPHIIRALISSRGTLPESEET